MAGFIVIAELEDDIFVEIDAGITRVWRGEGEPIFTGSLDDLKFEMPDVVLQLLFKGIIKAR